MKLVMTSMRWGNLYRSRYYIDGRRVSENAWSKIKAKHNPQDCINEQISGGYRATWEIL